MSGLSASDPRLQPAARNPQLVERVIAVTFLLGLVLVGGFGASFWVNAKPWILGATMGGGLFFLGVGLVAWGKYLMPRGPFVEDRHPLANTDQERDAFAAAIVERGGVDHQAAQDARRAARRRTGHLRRRRYLPVGAQPRSAAQGHPLPHGLALGILRRGHQPVDGCSVGDLAVGSIVTVFPEGTQYTDRGQAVDQTVLIRLSNENFTTQKGRETWGPHGYVAYSKLCTHLGCPVGLYEQQLQLLVCPCHQSMFNVTNGAIPNFGPAPRPLPQLPLYVDASGYLRAQKDYDQPVGPGFWERS